MPATPREWGESAGVMAAGEMVLRGKIVDFALRFAVEGFEFAETLPVFEGPLPFAAILVDLPEQTQKCRLVGCQRPGLFQNPKRQLGLLKFIFAQKEARFENVG